MSDKGLEQKPGLEGVSEPGPNAEELVQACSAAGQRRSASGQRKQCLSEERKVRMPSDRLWKPNSNA